LGKSFRTICLARNLFVTPVHEICCANLGGDFENLRLNISSRIIRTCAL